MRDTPARLENLIPARFYTAYSLIAIRVIYESVVQRPTAAALSYFGLCTDCPSV
jgi:hypothetical protein